MTLKQTVNDDMKAALKGGDKPRLAALRLLLAAIRQKEIDERIELDDAAIVGVIEKMLKQRKDSITQYDAAGRADLADAERFEAVVLGAYMPKPMEATEIDAIIAAAVAESGAASAADMGKVMALVKPRLAGRADMAAVSKAVKARLAG